MRVLTPGAPSVTKRVCDEVGVGKGDPEGVRLGLGIRPASSALGIGGKEGENEGGNGIRT